LPSNGDHRRRRGFPAGWKPELLKAGFAIIHDKTVVIDPFDDNGNIKTAQLKFWMQATV
jgi:hypothetical protein